MTGFLFIGLVLAVLGTGARYAARQRRLLHLFQLEHYEPARLWVWLRRRDELVSWPELAAGAVAGALAAVLYAADLDALSAIVLLAWAGAGVTLAVRSWPREEVKPLAFTGRAQRLAAAAMLPAAAMVAAATIAALADPSAVAFAILLAALVLLAPAAPGLLIAADLVLRPIQGAINRTFVRRARRRLAGVRPLTIGVTGSYGKTTTKFCIGGVVEADRPALVTPESYNSYLGVTRAINELLAPEHRAFVVEMGAYRAGDIRELCELVEPQIGVLTAVGPVHLERFGSIDAIAEAKAELPRSLPADGHFVTNADDEACRRIASELEVPTTLFGLTDDAEIGAADVRLAEGRCSFTLRLGDAERPIRAQLLGVHNVRNLLAAAAVGHVLRIDAEAIASALEAVEPPAHRLAPILNPQAGIVVIDDAYNSNPDGARAALEVLRDHEGQRRVLVTPGMVELGPLEDEANRELGRQAAAVCDHVILVGARQTRPIRDGLADAGFEDERTDVVPNLRAASERLGELTRRGDVILFENDLPDLYEYAEEDEGAGTAAPAGA